MASKEAKKTETTGLPGVAAPPPVAPPKKGAKKVKKAKQAKDILDFFAGIPDREAGAIDFGNGLHAISPEFKPSRVKWNYEGSQGSNPNFLNAKKTRMGRDVFSKDITFGDLCNVDTHVPEEKAFAVFWNEPNNLRYAPSGLQELFDYVDSRGVWLRDIKTSMDFKNKSKRNVYLQIHTPLANLNTPTECSWKVRHKIITLKPGQKYTYWRKSPPLSRNSPKKEHTFPDSANRCLAAELIEFRVMVEGLSAANETDLEESDVVLSYEVGNMTPGGEATGGVRYQSLSFVPEGSIVMNYPDHEFVWMESLAVTDFDKLASIDLDILGVDAKQTPRAKAGYQTTWAHPSDDYHGLRGVAIKQVMGKKVLMLVTKSVATAEERPLVLGGYEENATALLTDPAFVGACIMHSKGANWRSMYTSYNIFRHHHGSGAWLLWDEENDTFFDLDLLGWSEVSYPRYATLETPLMATTYNAYKMSDYKDHPGVVKSFNRLVNDLVQGGLCHEEATTEADRIFVEMFKRENPNDTSFRTSSLDWGKIFTSVFLGAMKIMIA